jgi:hypothetical protein
LASDLEVGAKGANRGEAGSLEEDDRGEERRRVREMERVAIKANRLKSEEGDVGQGKGREGRETSQA